VLKTLGVGVGKDLLISVHWPRKFEKSELMGYALGAVNLHNSYLPWNRGAHACTWAIVDQTPHGATMHWMDEGIDTGDILYQERVEIDPADTAHTLYQKTADAEVRVFTVGMELILAGNCRRFKQPQHNTVHRKRDFDRLVRALTTSDCKVIREA
jgi:methionyl-tRNA formyltransferase